jgi:hypothetical protein
LTHNIYDSEKAAVTLRLQYVIRFCAETGYLTAEASTKRVLDSHKRGEYSENLAEMIRDIRNIKQQIFDEIKARHFLHLSLAETRMYRDKQSFGAAVETAFPSATKDLREAAICLSLSRPTACVLHLMQALELVIKKCVMKALCASPKGTLTWSDLANKIREKVNEAGAIPGIDWAVDSSFLWELRPTWTDLKWHGETPRSMQPSRTIRMRQKRSTSCRAHFSGE